MRVFVHLVGCAYVSMQCVNAAKHELLCTGELSSLYFGSGLHVQATDDVIAPASVSSVALARFPCVGCPPGDRSGWELAILRGEGIPPPQRSAQRNPLACIYAYACGCQCANGQVWMVVYVRMCMVSFICEANSVASCQ